MHIANQASTKTASPVINFATETKTSLSVLIAAFAAAEHEVGEAATIEDEFPRQRNDIKILGGMSPATVIATEGKEPVTIPASEWFYRSRGEIERDLALNLANASAEDRAGIEERFAALLRECDQQSDAIKRAIPKGKKTAERRLAKAHRALNAAEDDIINFEPTSMSEAAALLEFVSCSGRSCFTPDDRDLHTIMRNAAAAIRAAQ
jgi:hypothetical protein